MRRLTSLLLALTGIVCAVVVAFLIWERNTPRRLAFDLTQNPTLIANSGTALPHILQIEGAGISLPIFPVELNNGRWTASTAGVSYLASSAIPGEIGNSILYGHNWPNLLGNLTQVKPGMQVTVGFIAAATQTFTVISTSTVTPDQTHILNPSTDRRLTIYTCTGFLDSKRFVVVAIPSSQFSKNTL